MGTTTPKGRNAATLMLIPVRVSIGSARITQFASAGSIHCLNAEMREVQAVRTHSAEPRNAASTRILAE